MAYEIERKFLVDISKIDTLDEGYIIKQGYIETTNKTTVRVRIRDQNAFLTIKGENNGIKRLEFEYEIPLDDANVMLEKLCLKSVIDKTRYELKVGNHVWEIDIFHGINKGLIVAEIELNDENETFDIPDWVTKEVTSERKYHNSNLILNPYSQW
ncbi:MAG: CYTH domain-containing protein [Sulfuricurvum sp.]|uniref:CYTH domain-containing protein n=1 Tax=Sulfuricurvum sp. TaxID=2025608 RepID=UPI0026164E7D|nr:CYTH domain-containing protein [Sulfuricurvum sp.]MDD2828118.1 CYTH domain-containing protein [Sulfuricurvum sp.]MDD4948008.1 CYTH domain-containing protein [Sulfuricurvum sp.]